MGATRGGVRSRWAVLIGAALAGGLLGCPPRGPGTSADGRNGTIMHERGTGEGGPAGGLRGDVRRTPEGGGSAGYGGEGAGSDVQ
jgi:hypothetical protein